MNQSAVRWLWGVEDIVRIAAFQLLLRPAARFLPRSWEWPWQTPGMGVADFTETRISHPGRAQPSAAVSNNHCCLPGAGSPPHFGIYDESNLLGREDPSV